MEKFRWKNEVLPNAQANGIFNQIKISLSVMLLSNLQAKQREKNLRWKEW